MQPSQSIDLQGFRLSPQQQHVWRTGRVLVSQCAVEVARRLEADRLRQALARAVERHEILRTTFQILPGMSIPVQAVAERGDFDFTQERWEGSSWESIGEEGRFEAIEARLAVARSQPFDLGAGPLLRVTAIEVDARQNLLLFTLPAMAFDGISARLLAAEVLAECSGLVPAGDVLQYADVAEILHEWLDAGGEGKDFWSHQDLAPLTRIRVGHAGAPAFPYRTVGRLLTREQTAAVKALAQDWDAPSWLVLLAAWVATLWHSTGEREIVVGTLFDGRTVAEFETALGVFGRVLPIRCFLDPAGSVGGLIAPLLAAVADAAEWQDSFPLTTGEWPVGFEHDSSPEVLTPGVVARGGASGAGPFGLLLSVRPFGGGLRIDLSYASERFTALEADRFVVRFLSLLNGVAADPEGSLAEVDILSEEERRELLVDFNATANASAEGWTTHGLFEERARISPDAPALGVGGLKSTYAELNARANRLAHHLRSLGVGPDAVVAICLKRSALLVEALFAVLKAGGAYVPLDSGYPAERLAYMLADSGASVLLTQEQLVPLLGPLAPAGIQLVCLDGEAPEAAEIAARSSADTGASVAPENLAYIIYTSGSTGRPKGVMIPHRALANYLTWARERYRVAGGGGAPVHSSFGFDLTVTSLLTPLVSGAPVTLLPEDEGVGALTGSLRSHSGFGLVKLTPAHLEVLRQTLDPAEAAGAAGALVIGGEALWAEALDFWREHAPAIRLINEYGPTEATVGCCVYEMGAEGDVSGPVPIGRPIANTRLYVLNPGVRPVPAGVAGELWIGGSGLARGYLGRPDLTAERFVPDPFSPAEGGVPGARLYRTGDLVRGGPSGNLEFLGRIDQQIKLRGYRIEPGEIESALTEHAGVREAVVTVREVAGGKSLVAYFVSGEGGAPSSAALEGFLRQRLPDYMVPTVFVAIPELPLTPNGKIDRRALPEPRDLDAGMREYVPPRTFEEDLLAEIWAQVLGLDRVGIDDPFFSIGGDSIRSVQVLSLAQERGINLSLQQLFQYPTIRALATQTAAGDGQSPEELETSPFSLLSASDRGMLPSGLEDAYPLARLQAGMLFHSGQQSGSSVYHDLHSFRLRGTCEIPLIRTAIGQVIQRHPVLRTSFDLSGFGEPLQLVHGEVEIPITFQDVRDLPRDEQRRTVQEWLHTERQRGFVWDQAPLLRFHVHRLAEDEFQFTLSFHHAVLDGWSAASLLSEVFGRYLSLAGGSPRPLQPLAARYSEFVALERNALTSGPAREFWRRRLDGHTILRLPRWQAAGPSSERSGARDLNIPLEAELSDLLRRLARESALPLKSVLLGIHLCVLGKLGSTGDVLTGLVTHGRPEHVDGDQVLGLFLNTLPIRMRLREGSWRALAQRAFAQEMEAIPFRRVPLAEIQREQGGQPLFGVVFNFLHYHVYRSLDHLKGLEVLERYSYEETNLPLTVHFLVSPADSRLSLILNYPELQFSEAEVALIGSRYAAAARAIANHPDAPWETADLLSEAERRQLLVEWNQTASSYPRNSRIHDLFEQQAGRNRDAIALVSRREQISYGELDRRADRVARRLLSLDLGLEAPVGLLAERSPEAIIGMLGVLKACACYVPIDPAWPQERLAFILRDAGCEALLVQQPGAGPVLPDHGIPAIDLTDATAAGFGDEKPLPPMRGLTAESLAYVMYTSGSTGTPKGVCIQHRGVVRLVQEADYVDLSEDQTILQLASLSFDASTFEIWGALLNGGRLVLAPGQGAGLAELAELLERHEVGTLWLTAALFHEVVDQGIDALRPVRQLLAGGDVLSPRHVEKLASTFESCRLINGYGPTEGTTFAACHTVGSDVEPSVPLGRPIADSTIYLFDPTLRPVGVGMPGEVCLGGDGLARCYLGQPALTAEKLVPHPYGTQAGDRLYRTGDFAMYRPDGVLLFLGRRDQQIKIRGFRIETAEIELSLNRHSGVRAAAVVVRENQLGEKRLVAYVVPRSEPIGPGDLRGFLAERIPDYMIPNWFVTVGELPISSSGKLDRRALPEPEVGRTGAGYTAPRTPHEELLASLWAQALRLERVGIHDNFYELGGDSIVGIQIGAKANQAGLRLSASHILQYPTIAQLAPLVETTSAPRDSLESAAGPVPLVPIQRWLFAQNLADPTHFNHAILMRVSRPVHPGVLAATLAQLTTCHEALRLRFVRDASGEWHQSIAPEERRHQLVQIDLAALPADRGREALEEAAAQLQTSLDLAEGPLVRVGLFELGAGRDGRLLLVIHHLAVDGISWRILLEDLELVFRQRERGKPSPLPARTFSFKAWAELLQQEAVSSDTLGEMDYWLGQTPSGSGLPVDDPCGNNSEASTETVSLSIEPEETKLILQALPALYRTQVNDVLLTALVYAFWRWNGESSFSVNMEHHGREALVPGIDLGRTVGWFTAMFPVLLRLEDPRDLERSLLSIKEQLRAIPRHGIGYGLLRYLGAEETTTSLRRIEAPQVSFNYLGRLDLALNASSFLSLAPESPGHSRSPLDRRFHVLDVSGRVLNGRFEMGISYSRNLHRRSTIQALADGFREGLSRLAEVGRNQGEALLTPADVPLSGLDQKGLDRLMELAAGSPELATAPLGIEDAYPLSPMQEGMVFHSLYTPDSGVYVQYLLCTFQSVIDEAVFRRAWEIVVERQAILRSWIAWQGLEKPLQVIQRRAALSMETKDWRDLPEAEQERRMAEAIEENRRRGFDITLPPLMRLVLARTADATYSFLWLHHHLLLDGWSRPLLVQEVLTCYEALLRSEEPRLPDPVPFRDYIAWLQDQDVQEAEAFWRGTLAGFTRPTPLPGDRGTPGSESGRGTRRELLLSRELTRGIKTLARQSHLTVNTLVQGAWAILLNRTSSEPEVAFGAVVSGRPPSLPGVDKMIGLFINTIPVRASIVPEAPLVPWLRELQRAQVEARRFDYVSLAQIQTWSDVPRGKSLFESLVVFENYPIETAGERVSSSIRITEAVAGGMGSYPLSLVVLPGDRLHLMLDFDPSRIEPATVERTLCHLEQILERMTLLSDSRLGDIMSLATVERGQIVDAFNEELEL